MKIKTKVFGNVIEVFIFGRLDIHLSLNIEKEISTILAENPKSDLLMNLHYLDYMDSSGLIIFIPTMRTLKKENRKMKLCNMSAVIKKMFEIFDILDMFEVYDSEEDALKSF